MTEDYSRVISIQSGKGGVGKTTLSINLAVVLSKIYEKRVLLIDANITTSHVGLFLGKYTFPQTVTLDKLLKKTAYPHSLYEFHQDFSILPSPLFFSKVSKKADIVKLQKIIPKIRKNFDVILIDSAPGIGREALASYMAADEVLFVTLPYVPAVIDILRWKEVMEEITKPNVGIVLNMVQNLSFELKQKEVEKITGLPVIEKIPMDKSVLKSLSLGSPVVLEYPTSKASKAIKNVARYIVDKEFFLEEEPFWKRWFSRFKSLQI